MDEALVPEGQVPALHGVEWDPEFVDELYDFLKALESRADMMAEDIAALVEEHGEIVYSELIYILSHLRFDEAEARPHWEQILEHRQSMLKRLGAPVDLLPGRRATTSGACSAPTTPGGRAPAGIGS